jgi:hypothetical protein
MLLKEIAPLRNAPKPQAKVPSQPQAKTPAQPINQDFDPEKAEARLLSRIDFASFPAETQAIRQRLQDRGIKPTLTNLKRYLVKCLTMPFDELPDEERSIIVRSGRAARFE